MLTQMYKRKAYSRETTIKKLNELLPKFTVLDLSIADIKEGFNLLNSDVEDSIHYVLSQKKKCDAILTNNSKDFLFFNKVNTIGTKLGVLKSQIQ